MGFHILKVCALAIRTLSVLSFPQSFYVLFVLPEGMQCPLGRFRPSFGVSFELFEQSVPAHLRKASGP
jgi:hypothetical protein